MIQKPIVRLLTLASKLTDNLNAEQLGIASAALDAVDDPLSEKDVMALCSLLPEDGDTASGLNWSIVHAIEASTIWPTTRALRIVPGEWNRILKLRLANAGEDVPV